MLAEQSAYTCKKYRESVGKELSRRVELVCQYHDRGKGLSEKWQAACQKDYESYLQWKQKNGGGSFKEYAKVEEEKAGKNIRMAGVRHEFYSLLSNKTLPLPLQAAIAAHHGKLGLTYEERWKNEDAGDFWGKFRIKSNRVIERRSLEESAKAHYEYAGLRGWLQLSDHRASAKEAGDFVPDLTPFKYTFPHPTKRGVQRLIQEYWQEDLLLVRAPTGAGKTDASLLWASLQIENQRAERLVIAMPTRFTSNALAINVSENLSDTGLYHSSAWFVRFQEGINNESIERQAADRIHEFARLLQTPITVCTIDHLLMALTLTREDHHLITFNLANACLVIDEADFYDDFTQANVLVLLELLKYWRVPVLIMSASLPESVLPSYNKIGYQIDKIIEDTSDNQRDRFEIKEIREYATLAEIEDLLELCIENGSAIIYANTVDKAILFYEWFAMRGVKPIVYHSRFTEPHKKDKEQELIRALGRAAWENGSARGIAILTQIGEMSINISADIMLSELCPVDRLTQRAGRLCRFDVSKLGQLYLLKPMKDGVLYPAPYGEYAGTGKGWIPCEALIATEGIIEKNCYNADKLVSCINRVYNERVPFSSKAISNAKKLKEYFSLNWLINSKQVTEKDATATNFWKSRDIAPQDTVFIQKPPTQYFQNYFEYQSWRLVNSVELPVYLIDRGKKQHMVDLISIHYSDETEQILVIRDGFYGYEKGVSFAEPDNML
jgi:CRISPR-associated endonuclease/helicase Cas3